MTWNAFRHRGEILRAVVAAADQRRDGRLPSDVPGVAENFENDLDLLAALLLKWHARLSGNIERTLAQQPLDLELAVARAWRRTAEEMPGVRAVVDRELAEGDEQTVRALRRATEREWVRLAAVAGLASDESAAAARAGRRLEQRARELPATVADTAAGIPTEDALAAGSPEQAVGEDVAASGATGTPSFVDRIKAVLAA
jgi:hypothetical protein